MARKLVPVDDAPIQQEGGIKKRRLVPIDEITENNNNEMVRQVAMGAKDALVGGLGIFDIPAGLVETAKSLGTAAGKTLKGEKSPQITDLIAQGIQENPLAPKLGQKFGAYSDRATYGETIPRNQEEMVRSSAIQGAAGGAPFGVFGALSGALGGAMGEKAVQSGATNDQAALVALLGAGIPQAGKSAVGGVGRLANVDDAALASMKKYNIQPTLGSVSGGASGKLTEAGIRVMPFGAAPVDAAVVKQKTGLAQRFANIIGTESDNLTSGDLNKYAMRAKDTFRNQYAPKYEALDSVLQDVTVQPSSVLKSAETLTKNIRPELQDVALSGGTAELIKNLKKASDSGQPLNYVEAKALLDDFSNYTPNSALIQNIPEGQRKFIAGALKKDIDSSIQQQKPEVFDKYRSVSSDYYKGKKQVNNVIKKLSDSGDPMRTVEYSELAKRFSKIPEKTRSEFLPKGNEVNDLMGIQKRIADAGEYYNTSKTAQAAAMGNALANPSTLAGGSGGAYLLGAGFNPFAVATGLAAGPALGMAATNPQFLSLLAKAKGVKYLPTANTLAAQYGTGLNQVRNQ